MKPLLTAGILAASGLLAQPALALDTYDDTYTYAALSVHNWDSDSDNGQNPDASATGGKITFGQQLTPLVGVEVQGALGGSDESGGSDVKLEHMVGLYVRGNLPLGRINPYLKIGASSASLEVKTDTGTQSNSEFEFSYGLGAELSFTDALYMQLEYMSYIDTDDLQLSGASVGVGYRFR